VYYFISSGHTVDPWYPRVSGSKETTIEENPCLLGMKSSVLFCRGSFPHDTGPCPLKTCHLSTVSHCYFTFSIKYIYFYLAFVWRVDYEKLVRTGAQLLFLRLSVGQHRHRQPQPIKRGKCRTAAFPELFMFREAGTQVSPVTMPHLSLRTAAPPGLSMGIKDSQKKDARLLVFGFWMKGGFLIWEALEGKRIAVGKVLEEDCS
jgi:hypothetical protein